MQHRVIGRLASLLTAIVAALTGSVLFAHHSTAEYDASQIVEARGEVVSVIWRNPHVRFQVSTKSIDGNERLTRILTRSGDRLNPLKGDGG